MMGSSLRKKNIKKTPSRNKKVKSDRRDRSDRSDRKDKKFNAVKTRVEIDGFDVPRSRRVTVCVQCAKTGCTNKKHNRHLCTSAGYWYDIKKKYNSKIMGGYRLAMWVHKQDEKLKSSTDELKSL